MMTIKKEDLDRVKFRHQIIDQNIKQRWKKVENFKGDRIESLKNFISYAKREPEMSEEIQGAEVAFEILSLMDELKRNDDTLIADLLLLIHEAYPSSSPRVVSKGGL